MSGAFSMVCSNGMTIRVPGFEHVGEDMSRKHIGFDPQIAYDAVQSMSDSFGGFFNTVAEMTQHDLTDDQRLDMSLKAREIRFDGNDSIDPKPLAHASSW
jgi:hypothetical protein